jgi:PKD repeat protein
VTDNEGGIVTRTIEIEVTNRPPVLILSPPLSADGTNLISLKKGLNIDLAKSSDIDGATLDYYYDPGEGGSTGWVGESGYNYFYTSIGTFTLTVMVKDDDGVEIQKNYIIEVVDNNPPMCSIVFSPMKPEVGQKVTIKAVYNDPEGKVVEKFMWNFGIDDPYNDQWLSISEKPITYKEAGTYTISLYVEDPTGLVSQESTAEITVYDVGKGGGSDLDKGSKGGGLPWLWIASGVTALIIVIIVVVLISKGGKEQDETNDGDEYEDIDTSIILDEDESTDDDDSFDVEW